MGESRTNAYDESCPTVVLGKIECAVGWEWRPSHDGASKALAEETGRNR